MADFDTGNLQGGRAVHNGGQFGIRTGEGPSVSDAQRHKIKIFDHFSNQVVDVEVPEDRYKTMHSHRVVCISSHERGCIYYHKLKSQHTAWLYLAGFRYILWEAEDAGLALPYACRMGCCTVCAVRVKEGELYQPEGLGEWISIVTCHHLFG